MEPKEPTRRLVELAQDGDIAAFDALAERFRDRVEASVKARLSAHGLHTVDADDIVQETFVRALQAVERFEWQEEQEGDAFYRWLSGIARRVVLVASRDRARRLRGLGMAREVVARGPSPSKTLSREERFRRLQGALQGLSKDHREVLLLARIEGLTMKEIARRTGRSPAAVKQLVFRALRSLREVFGDTASLHLGDGRLDADAKDAATG